MNHLLRALRYSVQGIRMCFRDEIAFRQEIMLAIPHFIAICALPLTVCVRLYLVALWFVLVAVELLNTAIEATVNLVTDKQHPLAGKAKDCASAAIFCILLLMGVSWMVVVVSSLAD